MGAGTVSGELQCGERAPNNCMIVLLVRSVMAPDARGGLGPRVQHWWKCQTGFMPVKCPKCPKCP